MQMRHPIFGQLNVPTPLVTPLHALAAWKGLRCIFFNLTGPTDTAPQVAEAHAAETHLPAGSRRAYMISRRVSEIICPCGRIGPISLSDKGSVAICVE